MDSENSSNKNNEKKSEFAQKIVRDRLGYTHYLEKELSRGGQGVTYFTKDPSVIIKFAIKNIGTVAKPDYKIIDKKSDPEEFLKLQSQFQNVKLLPLQKNIHITVPQALIVNKAGYVMRFMEDMEPLYNLICNTFNFYEYNETGGLRRRLEISARSFAILAQLQSSGIIFGDISPNNIFITKDKNSQSPNVWFIDCDNMKTLSSKNQSGCFTPKFGAPEVVKGMGFNSIYSDIYSLAICTFYLCSMCYPFYGEMLQEDDGGGWDDSVDSKAASSGNDDNSDGYAKAERGDFPFIDDFNDDSNMFDGNGTVPPRNYFFTDELMFLFNKMFSKEGRTKAETRPSVYHWIRAFTRAADITVKCNSNCCLPDYENKDFYNKEYDNLFSSVKDGEKRTVNIKHFDYLMKTPDTVCPYCDKAFSNGIIILKDEKVIFAREFSCNNRNYVVNVPERLFKSFNIDFHNNPLFKLTVENNIKDYCIKIDKKRVAFDEEPISLSLSYKERNKLQSFFVNKEDEIQCGLNVKTGKAENNYKIIIRIDSEGDEK